MHSQTDTTLLDLAISKNTGWPDSPQLCNSLMFSMNLHEKALLEQKYVAGNMPLLTPTTALGHVVILRLSPLPQLLRNVVEELALGGGGSLKTH